jgi:hypothetical protein
MSRTPPRRLWAAFWLIVVLPLLFGESIYKETRRAWRNLAIRRHVQHQLVRWHDLWCEHVRSES